MSYFSPKTTRFEASLKKLAERVSVLRDTSSSSKEKDRIFISLIAELLQKLGKKIFGI